MGSVTKRIQRNIARSMLEKQGYKANKKYLDKNDKKKKSGLKIFLEKLLKGANND